MRALHFLLDREFPHWPQGRLHESSPAGVSSLFLKKRSHHYSCSHYWPNIAPGSTHNRTRCEDLEALTFADESFDFFISQDVMEHILRPKRAFSEIARVLKPGGAHVFTVPLYSHEKTLVRAVPGNGGIRHLLPPNYHGNPVDPHGSLVVREWGSDLVEFIRLHSGLESSIYAISSSKYGIEGEMTDVIISRKSG